MITVEQAKSLPPGSIVEYHNPNSSREAFRYRIVTVEEYKKANGYLPQTAVMIAKTVDYNDTSYFLEGDLKWTRIISIPCTLTEEELMSQI